MVTTPTSPNLLHFKDTAARLSLSESSLKRRLKEDQSFPRPVQVGKRRIAFIEAEIDAFIHARIADRDRAGSKAA